jgi:hypothetical protein
VRRPAGAHLKTAAAAIVCIFAASLVLSGCAPGPDELAQAGSVAGFWRGLWHGLIAPVTFVISLFNHDVGIYEIRNNGHMYDLGFVLGILCLHGGATARRRRG